MAANAVVALQLEDGSLAGHIEPAPHSDAVALDTALLTRVEPEQ